MNSAGRQDKGHPAAFQADDRKTRSSTLPTRSKIYVNGEFLMFFPPNTKPIKTFLYNADPDCVHVADNRWSGVGCRHCHAWFCY